MFTHFISKVFYCEIENADYMEQYIFFWVRKLYVPLTMINDMRNSVKHEMVHCWSVRYRFDIVLPYFVHLFYDFDSHIVQYIFTRLYHSPYLFVCLFVIIVGLLIRSIQIDTSCMMVMLDDLDDVHSSMVHSPPPSYRPKIPWGNTCQHMLFWYEMWPVS